MKTRTAKSIGAAALGVAFAAAAGGTASAAPALPTLPAEPSAMTQDALDQVPVELVAKSLPGGAPSSYAAERAIDAGTATVPMSVGQALPSNLQDAGQNAGLLGGLPIG